MLSMPLFSFRAAQDNVLSVFQVLKPSFMDLSMELQMGKKIRLCLEFLMEVKITHILLIDNSAAKQVAKKRGNGRLRDVSGTLLFGHRTKQTPRLWRSSKLEQRTMLATLARPLGQGSPLCLHVLAQPP